MVPIVVLSQSKPVFNTAVRLVCAAMPKIMVTRPRLAHPIVTKSKSPIRRHIIRSPSPKTSTSPSRVTIAQAPVVSAAQGVQGTWELNGGYVTFGGNHKAGKITGKGKIKTCKLDFEDVYFVKELKFNLFSVSQMCDKKNNVLFTDTKFLVLSSDFKLPEESQVLLRVPRENNMYNSVIFQQQEFTKIILYHKLLKEPKRVHQALNDPSWIKAMQEELLQFKMQKVWVLVDLPQGKRAIVRIEAIRLFLAYASFMGFMVYQMDVKSAFIYGTIKEEVYVYQPPGFEDPDHLDKVYKVVKALYGLHQAPRACQDKYVAEILRKFRLTKGKSASTLIETEKPLLKDHDGEDGDVHTYWSMIGSLIYLTLSRPDIMFAVCACARFQVTPKALHLHAVKRIFRYLKDKPHLGLWYLKDSPFDLVAYSDSDYAGASLDRKYTTRGCQFLRCRLISWQCKKQTVVATSSTEAEYVAAASCCAQVLWIQNQMLDYGPDQMVSGKDETNLLMADNFPKIVWYSTHHDSIMKSWLVQKKTALGQTATGKEISNPFMAGSLPKIIMKTFIHENDVTRLQALVDKKKVVVTEAAIRDVLRLDDAEGVD
nr:uncharacterized mitochondrial protein AtMg00810-like [Tanacetum cinerariifolium]